MLSRILVSILQCEWLCFVSIYCCPAVFCSMSRFTASKSSRKWSRWSSSLLVTVRLEMLECNGSSKRQWYSDRRPLKSVKTFWRTFFFSRRCSTWRSSATDWPMVFTASRVKSRWIFLTFSISWRASVSAALFMLLLIISTAKMR